MSVNIEKKLQLHEKWEGYLCNKGAINMQFVLQNANFSYKLHQDKIV